MEDKFIWNIDQDTIHFVNSFDFEEPLEDDYITGEYFAPQQSVVLYTDNVRIPINVDYFIRLWKASEPSKEIKRDRIELMQLKNSNNKFSKTKLGKNEQKILSLFFELSTLNNLDHDTALVTLLNFMHQNPSPEDVRRFFTPTIAQYNRKMLEEFYPDNFPQRPSEWKNLSEEEVFRYVEQFSRNLSRNNPSSEQEIINQLMNRWHQTGVPIDINDYIIDESLVDWNSLLGRIQKMGKKSNFNKKADHQGMTNWETWNTDVTMENDYELSQFFYGLIARNASIEDFANEAIKKVVGPHNKDLLEQFDAISDEEEVEMKMQSDLENWQYDAERRHPNDPEAQQEYVDKMKEIVYGIMGEPEPTDIANYWIDEAKINWEEIYNKWKRNWEAEQNYKESKWKKI